MTVCAAVVLAFGLAACGSSDDDSAADDGTPAVTEPAGPTQAALDAEKARADAAEAELAAAEADANMAKMEGLFAAIKLNVENVLDSEGVPVRAADGDPDPAGVEAIAPKAMPPVADSRVMDDKGDGRMLPFGEHFTLNTNRVHELASDADTSGAASDRFPHNGGSVTYTPEDNDDNSLTAANVELSGTLMSAPGTFRCDGDACMVTERAGKYRFAAGWTFDADDGAMVTIEDGDYSQWGWWAFERKNGTYRVETFTAAMDDDDITAVPGNVASLGTATYMGSANGKYAIDNRPTGDVLEAAHFDADATIKAVFGATSTVSGTIDNFMVDGNAKDWSVALGKTGITWGNATLEPAVRDFATTVGNTPDPADTEAETVGGGVANVWTIGGVKDDAAGDWSGDFHHDGAARNDGTPASVIGQFTASHGTNAYMTGAFGAHNMAPDTKSAE